MKKITFLLALICFSATLAQSYDFSVHTETYQDLDNPTSLNNDEVWDDPQFEVPVGFDFQIGDNVINTLYFSLGAGGFLTSGESFSDPISVFVPIGQDLEDRGNAGESLSPISYQLDGTPGQQILKIEWNNAGFWEDTTGDDFINYQVWLYEGTNVIEYRYGPNAINNPGSFEGASGPITAFLPSIILDSETLLEPGLFLSGNPANPTVHLVENEADAPENTLVGAIPDGTVYRFTPETTTSISELKNIEFRLYPNPVKDYFTITKTNSNSFMVEIYNSIGQRLKSFNAAEGEKINISNLASGFYIIKLKTEKGNGSMKIVKE